MRGFVFSVPANYCNKKARGKNPGHYTLNHKQLS